MALSLSLAGCATSYESSWSDAERMDPLDLQGKRIATFLLVPSEDRRRAVETLLAQSISERGPAGVPGHQVLSRSQMDDPRAARERLADQDVEGVLLMRPIGQSQESRYVPGRSYYANQGYDSLWGYWSVWGQMTHEPGHYEIDQKVLVEALYFSVPDDRLLWGGVTEVNGNTDVGRMFRRVVSDTAREMQRAGLL